MGVSPWGREKGIGERAEVEGMTVAWKRMEDADLDLCLSPKMCVLC